MGKLIYATDLDRTLIFSYKFLEEYPSNSDNILVESVDGKELSYMDKQVIEQLREIHEQIEFIPVTARSIEEYNRVNLPVKPEYAIVANGGIILHNGEPIKEWESYKQKHMPENYAMDMLDITMDLQMSKALVKQPRIVDHSYVFFRISDRAQWESEELHYYGKYKNWDFGLQGRKVYATPKHFSKQVALRWLWNKLDTPKIIASGDSVMDVPMLSLANKAIIPSHSELLLDKLLDSARVAEGGIQSPLYTIGLIKAELNNSK